MLRDVGLDAWRRRLEHSARQAFITSEESTALAERAKAMYNQCADDLEQCRRRTLRASRRFASNLPDSPESVAGSGDRAAPHRSTIPHPLTAEAGLSQVERMPQLLRSPLLESSFMQATSARLLLRGTRLRSPW